MPATAGPIPRLAPVTTAAVRSSSVMFGQREPNACERRGPAGHTRRVADGRRILVTGATGKVGQALIARLLATGDERFAGSKIRALCHNRLVDAGPRLEVISGSIDRREVV